MNVVVKSLVPVLFLAPLSQADIIPIEVLVPVAETPFSDTEDDFFGVVITSDQIDVEGVPISFIYENTTPFPPINALVGRDHDGDSTPLQVASWSLELPADAVPGTGLTSISFDAVSHFRTSLWEFGEELVTEDFAIFELILNEAVFAALDFRPTGENNTDLRLDTDGDGIGDGLVLSPSSDPTTEVPINLSDPGGASITSVELRLSISSDTAGEQHWTLGSLSAEYDSSELSSPSPTELMAPEIEVEVNGEGQAVLSWLAQDGITHRVQYSEDLLEWVSFPESLQPAVTSAPEQVSFTDTTDPAAESRFYQVTVSEPAE